MHSNPHKPKFLLLCDTYEPNPWARDRIPFIKLALSNYDYHIIDIYEFKNKIESDYIHKTKAIGFFENKNLIHLNKLVYEKILLHKPNIVIWGTADNFCHYLMPETLFKLNKQNILNVGIMGDDEFAWPRNQYFLKMFNVNVAYVKGICEKYQNFSHVPCFYLPNSCGFSETNFDRLNNISTDIDLLFIGSPYGKRKEYIEHLIQNNINVKIFGSKSWLESKIAKDHYLGYVDSNDMDKSIQRSKIVLAMLEDHLDGSLHMNTKIWEAIRNGRMCIATEYSPLFTDYGLTEGETIVTYKDLNHLLSQVQKYLSNDTLRTQIARASFNYVYDSFNYQKLYSAFFVYLEKIFAATNIRQKQIQKHDSQYYMVDNLDSVDFNKVTSEFIIINPCKYSYSDYLNVILRDNLDKKYPNVSRLKVSFQGSPHDFNHLLSTTIWKKSFLEKCLENKTFASELFKAELLTQIPLCHNKTPKIIFIKDIFIRKVKEYVKNNF